MFENKYFYHGTHKRLVIAFGSLFNSLQIQRQDGEFLPVPITFAPKEHFLAKLNANNADEKISQVLPRMSFFIGDGVYNSQEEVDPLEKCKIVDPVTGVTSHFQPVPYVFPVTLSIWTKYVDDKYQILEQILPYFRPEFIVTLRGLEGVQGSEDVPIKLEGFSSEDNYESLVADKRIINTDLNFEMEAKLYPIVEQGSVIKQVIVNLSDDEEDGLPAEQCTATVNPFTANEDEAYTIDLVSSYITE